MSVFQLIFDDSS